MCLVADAKSKGPWNSVVVELSSHRPLGAGTRGDVEPGPVIGRAAAGSAVRAERGTDEDTHRHTTLPGRYTLHRERRLARSGEQLVALGGVQIHLRQIPRADTHAQALPLLVGRGPHDARLATEAAPGHLERTCPRRRAS